MAAILSSNIYVHSFALFALCFGERFFSCSIARLTDKAFSIATMNQRTEEAMAANAVQFDKRTYTVDEIQDILGISRTSAYNLVKKKVFHSVRIGGSIRISKKSFDEWLDHQM